MTVYLYTLPFPVALRLWDVFLFEGYHYTFAVALALIKIYADKMLEMPFEELFQFLKLQHLKNSKNELDVEELLKKANSYKEGIKRDMKSYERAYEKYKNGDKKKKR